MEFSPRGSEGAARTETDGLTQTNWWVLTGGPSAGKTTIINELAARGYRTVSEAARDIIDEGISEGKTLDEVRGDGVEFQTVIFDRKERREEALPTNELIFFDRGSQGDTLAYLAFVFGDQEPMVERDFFGRETITAIARRRYKGIFILDRLPFEKDYARSEDDEQAARIHNLLQMAYAMLGYEPINVPVMPVEQRVQFILNHVHAESS